MQEETYTIIVNSKNNNDSNTPQPSSCIAYAHHRMDVVNNTIQTRVFK